MQVAIYLFVALCDCTIYWWIGLDLWLVFGVLAFFLSFIPNIGMAVAICLPMPIVVLEPSFSVLNVAFAFLGPTVVGTIGKDVLEPLVLGNATSLHPVAVVLVIMLFGSVWGITGMVSHDRMTMGKSVKSCANCSVTAHTTPQSPRELWPCVSQVMAVPMTAVIRLILANIEHPMTRQVAEILSGAPPQLNPTQSEVPQRVSVISPRMGLGSSGVLRRFSASTPSSHGEVGHHRFIRDPRMHPRTPTPEPAAML